MKSCRQLMMMIHRLFFPVHLPPLLPLLDHPPHPITLQNPITLPYTITFHSLFFPFHSEIPILIPSLLPILYSFPASWPIRFLSSPIPFPVPPRILIR